MNNQTRTVRAALVGGAMLTVSLFALPAPAGADSESFPDDDTTQGSMDIHRVIVTNEKRLRIRVKVDDLQRRSGRSAIVWIDTKPKRSGPEYQIASGLWDSDWQIGRARGWTGTGNGPLNCPVDQQMKVDRDVVTWTTGPACLGDYSSVRVSVETQAGDTIDYGPSRHKFHPSVERY